MDHLSVDGKNNTTKSRKPNGKTIGETSDQAPAIWCSPVLLDSTWNIRSGGGNWGTLRIPRQDWGILGNLRESPHALENPIERAGKNIPLPISPTEWVSPGLQQKPNI